MELNITTTHKSNIKLSAEDWDLYTTSMKCGSAANALNKRFNSSVNKGLDRSGVYHAMWPVMAKYSSYGASDSEPGHVLDFLLRKVFGEEE